MSASDREKEIVASTLANNFLFSSMQTEQLNELASQMIRLEHGEGYRLITQERAATTFTSSSPGMRMLCERDQRAQADPCGRDGGPEGLTTLRGARCEEQRGG